MSSSRKPRLLLVGHTYAAVENRKKLIALAAHFDLVCVTSTTEQGSILGRSASDFDNESDATTRPYELVRCARVGSGATTFRYAGLADVMRRGTFDIVLVENEPWALVRWQARLLKGRLQPQALFGEFTWENVERPAWKGIVLRRIYRAMTATTDFVIAGNEAASALVRDRGMPPARILVAPELGVDLANHHPATPEERRELRRSQSLPENGFVVGYCGRLTEEKGLRELVEACAELQPDYPQLHLAIVGAGRLQSWLQEQAQSRPWLHLLPPRPHFEVPGFLRCLDVFVLGSKPVRTMQQCWEEQFGHVLIEAMACGVATLGSTSGAIPEVLGHNGAVFPWGDQQSLTERLRHLAGNPSAHAALADSQLERTRKLYTNEAVARQWAHFIQNQLEK